MRARLVIHGPERISGAATTMLPRKRSEGPSTPIEWSQSPARCMPRCGATNGRAQHFANAQILQFLRRHRRSGRDRAADIAERCPTEVPRAVAAPSLPRSDGQSRPPAGFAGDREPAPGTRNALGTVARFANVNAEFQ
jgi:hypothetical protein